MRIGSILRSFLGRREGQVALTFALCLTPVTFLVGAALDYSGASDLHTRLQRATDGANLQLCQMSGTPTQAQMAQAAQTYMTSLMGGTSFTIDNVVYTPSPRKIHLITSSNFSTAIVRAFSDRLRVMTVGADSECFGQPQTFEIALVLDNTGSMANSSGGQSKMDALKTAAANFVNSIYTNNALGPNTKTSLVPFAAAVAVDPSAYRSASWIDQNGGASNHWSFIQGGAATAGAYSGYGIHSRFDVFNYIRTTMAAWDWTGCLESLPYPLNTQDNAPTPSNPNSYYVPMFGPDESGPGGQFYHQDGSGNWIVSANSYMDDTNANCAATTDESTLTGQACKYVQITNPKTSNGYTVTAPNAACTTRPLTRLTTNKSTLLSEISLMQPNGNTDIHEGVMWGWRTLSPNSVFADGASYTKQYNNKVLIIMTDGMNTWTTNPYNPTLKSAYSAYGYLKNPDGSSANDRLPAANANPTSDAQTRAAMDALTLGACRNAAATGITIYTIGFSVASDPIDQQGINMLQTCAGSSSRAFVANDSNSIVSVFNQIAANIGNLKLTQ